MSKPTLRLNLQPVLDAKGLRLSDLAREMPFPAKHHLYDVAAGRRNWTKRILEAICIHLSVNIDDVLQWDLPADRFRKERKNSDSSDTTKDGAQMRPV